MINHPFRFQNYCFELLKSNSFPEKVFSLWQSILCEGIIFLLGYFYKHMDSHKFCQQVSCIIYQEPVPKSAFKINVTFNWRCKYMQIKSFFIDWKGSAFVATFTSGNVDKVKFEVNMAVLLLYGERELQHEGSILYSLWVQRTSYLLCHLWGIVLWKLQNIGSWKGNSLYSAILTFDGRLTFGKFACKFVAALLTFLQGVFISLLIHVTHEDKNMWRDYCEQS